MSARGNDDGEYSNSDAEATPKNEMRLSPDGWRTPRIMSSCSLAGEDIVMSARRSSDHHFDVELSPFTPSDGSPNKAQIPTALTPPSFSSCNRSPKPEMQQSVQSLASFHKQEAPTNTRPPRIPQVPLSLPPTARNADFRHGSGNSVTENSFLSALTESSSDLTIPTRRTVSWDINDPMIRAITDRRVAGSPGGFTSVSHMSTPASILQPILHDLSGPVAPPASIVTSEINAKLATMPYQRPDIFKTSNKSSNISNFSDTGIPLLWNPPVSLDTGSFVATSGSGSDNPCIQTPPSRNLFGSKPYSLQDVLNATPTESEEEVLVMKKIESQRGLKSTYQAKDILLPHISDDRVHDFDDLAEDDVPYIAGEASETTKAESEKERRESNTLQNLTKQLMEGTRPDSNMHLIHRLNDKGTSPFHHSTQRGHHRRVTSNLPNASMYAAAETLFGSAVEATPENPDIEAQEESEQPGSPMAAPRRQRRRCFRTYRKKIRDYIVFFGEFIGSHNASIRREFFNLLRWIMLPCLATATLLFYGLGNPPHQMQDVPEYWNTTQKPKVVSNPDVQLQASRSWWFLFLGVRQLLTLDLARISQLVVIDFLVYRTKIFPRIIGPTIGLVVAQSKGWPCVVFFWAVWDFALLYGNRQFARHWAYWQDWIGMFNEQNPSGGITQNHTYEVILIFAIGISVAASLKRAFVGLLVGKRIVRTYRRDMERLLKEIVVIGDVAALSLSLIEEKKDFSRFGSLATPAMLLAEDYDAGAGTDDSFEYSDAVGSIVSKENNPRSKSGHTEVSEMLEQWEEPELEGEAEEEITMATILYFRRAQEFIADDFPFTGAFGSVRTREQCIECAQDVFTRLAKGSSIPIIDFTNICTEATLEDGQVDRARVKEFIRVFRPNRNGQLTKLEFIKSIDSVYKRVRLLLASIKNSSQIDAAYAKILNIGFFIISFIVFLAILGADVHSLILGLSGVAVSFAFMIGSASSNYLEGILFVLARKPYDIGDRVEVNRPIDPVDNTASAATWIVEKVDLYTTTGRLGTSGEVATFSNGSLAGMRIINLRRSEKPNVFMYLKFGVETTVQQRKVFRIRMTSFIKERPREWLKLVGFRVNRIEADLGYVEYVLIVQHRETWQSMTSILQSKSDVYSYALELQAELNMQYKAPHVPIDLRHVDAGPNKAPDEIGQISSLVSTQEKKEK